MFQKILVPTDGSPAAFRAAEAVAEMVGAFGPGVEVTVAQVIAPIDPARSDLDTVIIREANERMRRQAQRALEKTAAAFVRRDVAHRTEVLIGEPTSAAIAAEAERGGYDLIAMGSRGLGIQKDSYDYVGSVTERVIRRVRIPVLVVPVHQEEGE